MSRTNCTLTASYIRRNRPQQIQVPEGGHGEQLKVLSWNIHGLCRKFTFRFFEYVNDFDILLFSETSLSSKTSSNLDINGYFSQHIFGNKSPGTVKGRYSGGISLYAKNYLKNKIKIVEQNQNGVLWIKLSSDLFTFKEYVFICSVLTREYII